jgi:hypothetical protein
LNALLNQMQQHLLHSFQINQDYKLRTASSPQRLLYSLSQGSSVSSSKKLVTGRLSSHPSCLIILDSIDPKPEETKQYMQTLSSVIHALVSISPHLRILMTTRSSEICQLQPPLSSTGAADDAPPSPSFSTKVIDIGRL